MQPQLTIEQKIYVIIDPIVTAFFKLFSIAFADLSFIRRNCTISSKKVQENCKEEFKK